MENDNLIHQGKSYREGGRLGDNVYFKIAPGIYLNGIAYTQNKNDLDSENGFFANNLIFTEELFNQSSAPTILSMDNGRLIFELTQKIETRKQELDRSVPPCEDNKNQTTIPLPTTTTVPPLTPKKLKPINIKKLDANPVVMNQPNKPLPVILPTKKGEVIATPVFTQDQLNQIFDPKRKLKLEVVWNQNTLTKHKEYGDEASSIFKKLSKSKLFALLFADLFEVNRSTLDALVAQYLNANEQLVVKIYFQR